MSGLRTHILFSKEASWAKLASQIGQGATVRSTPLTDEYDYEAYCAAQDKQSLKLFALNERGKLKVFSSQDEFEPEPGWTVISMSIEPNGN